VTTYRGVVQLSGFVDSEAEKSQAAQVARNVQGVETLHNDLRVKPRDR
jgi:hyperosmotically inducible periplasmic protein